MSQLKINGNYKIIEGTGDFTTAISNQSDLTISITYPEFAKCDNNALHIAIISGNVNPGVKYNKNCNEQKLLSKGN